MKKAFIVLTGVMLFAIASCGPSQKEEEKQKRTDDSLFEKDRNTALDNADKFLSDTTVNKDSVAKAGKAVKK
jgi:hypothetical protein